MKKCSFSNGAEYVFYIAGVDHTNDFNTSFGNLGNIAFEDADDLWTNVINNVKLFVNSNGRSATMYTPATYIIRPEWGKVADFLTGHKTLAQLKADLHCP